MRGCSSLLLLGYFAILANSLQAQDHPAPKLVSIQGVVVDDEQAPVGSAEVALSQEGGKQAIVRSGNDGRFVFSNVPLSPGKLTVRRMGYRAHTVTLDMFKVNGGQPIKID